MPEPVKHVLLVVLVVLKVVFVINVQMVIIKKIMLVSLAPVSQLLLSQITNLLDVKLLKEMKMMLLSPNVVFLPPLIMFKLMECQ